MEAVAKISNKLSIKFDFSNMSDLMKKIGPYEEIFGITECGACNSEDIRYMVREVIDSDPKKKGKTYEYHELVCHSCRAKLAFGLKQDGETLFPKRKGEDGNWLDNGGWTKWSGPKKEDG